jgi:hypothetical protein
MSYIMNARTHLPTTKVKASGNPYLRRMYHVSQTCALVARRIKFRNKINCARGVEGGKKGGGG